MEHELIQAGLTMPSRNFCNQGTTSVKIGSKLRHHGRLYAKKKNVSTALRRRMLQEFPSWKATVLQQFLKR